MKQKNIFQDSVKLENLAVNGTELVTKDHQFLSHRIVAILKYCNVTGTN